MLRKRPNRGKAARSEYGNTKQAQALISRG